DRNHVVQPPLDLCPLCAGRPNAGLSESAAPADRRLHSLSHRDPGRGAAAGRGRTVRGGVLQRLDGRERVCLGGALALCLSQPAGALAFASRRSIGRLSSQKRPTTRLPLKPSDASEASQTTGARITSGLSIPTVS